jgi:predicted transcriptional regulator
MKLEVAMLVGAESKAFLATLTEQIDRLEKLTAGIAAPTKATKKAAAPAPVEDEEAEESEDKEFTAPTKATKKAAAKSFDEDESENEEAEEETAPAPKSKKAKKVTLDDVNDACKARAADTGGKEGRTEVLGILKKKFKVASVSELKPEQYQAVIEAMAI